MASFFQTPSLTTARSDAVHYFELTQRLAEEKKTLDKEVENLLHTIMGQYRQVKSNISCSDKLTQEQQGYMALCVRKRNALETRLVNILNLFPEKRHLTVEVPVNHHLTPDSVSVDEYLLQELVTEDGD